MTEFIIIILLIIIIYLYKNDNSAVNREHIKYKPISLDYFIDEPSKEIPTAIEESKTDKQIELPSEITENEKKIDEIIDNSIEYNDPVYDMFVNKLNDNTSDNRIFKDKLMYDYRNMDAIEKTIKQNNYHHMTQRFSM